MCHYTSIVSEFIVESGKRLQPLPIPLLAPIAPPSSPLTHAPRISDSQEPLSVELDGFDDRVGMIYDEAIRNIRASHVKHIRRMGIIASEGTIFADVQEFVFPEFVGVEDVLIVRRQLWL